ncbi:Shr3p [Sugiyamaella lignohabitans]|uniref:Shr3p n=1 Tax=Sugiyamaella lignohabitans TaxID=796027 RepID=A0A167CIJ2_9ASCO|nr:Shr3p [Sugiyamaella lignohabitans]ANB11744.1 Shr3p [Sugiyamaella lignohabitans]
MPTSATSFSTGLILCATSFSLGAIYSNWAYDYYTLWTSHPTNESFALSLSHYQTWANMPTFLHHVHHFIIGLGFLGLFIKLYKPSESNTLFDGGSLFLYVIAVAFYISNLQRGVFSAVAGEWGDVDEHTGINVIAATQVFIVLVLLGVVGLQFGQYWAELEDATIRAKADAEEIVSEEKDAEPEKTEKPIKESKKTK